MSNMKELFKNQYKNVILVCCYIIITTLVYTVCADCLWDIWFLDVIVGILIAALGCYIGYKYIKSEEEIRVKKLEEQAKANEEVAKETESTDSVVETVEDKEEKIEENSVEE